jgi:hypothetical protein
MQQDANNRVQDVETPLNQLLQKNPESGKGHGGKISVSAVVVVVADGMNVKGNVNVPE